MALLLDIIPVKANNGKGLKKNTLPILISAGGIGNGDDGVPALEETLRAFEHLGVLLDLLVAQAGEALAAAIADEEGAAMISIISLEGYLK